MPASQQLRSYGPQYRTFSCSQVGTGFGGIRTIYMTDSPRASQEWKIESVFFRFPESTKGATVEETSTKLPKIEFSISLIVNNEIRAEQTFTESISKPPGLTEGLTESLHIVGSLETYTPLTIGPQDTLTIQYSGFSNDRKIAFLSGPGEVIMTYTLLAR
jgi:hypothetical protein